MNRSNNHKSMNSSVTIGYNWFSLPIHFLGIHNKCNIFYVFNRISLISSVISLTINSYFMLFVLINPSYIAYFPGILYEFFDGMPSFISCYTVNLLAKLLIFL